MASSVIDTLIAEAGSDPEGLRAVAWVIQNRANQWGLTPEQVVKQRGQFEGYSSPGPKSREAQKSAKVRAKAEAAWQAVTSGSVPDPTNGGTSFRAKGTKQPAPHGTVAIGGNVFALGRPNSALAAIDMVAPKPLPAPAPLRAAYAPERQNTGSYTLAPPNLPLNPPLFQPKSVGFSPPTMAETRAEQQRAPSRGVGTSYLAPAKKVQTIRIDPLTNQPIQSANATKAAPESVWFTSKPPTGPVLRPSEGRSFFERPGLQGTPFIGPILGGVASALTLADTLGRGGTAVAKPAPVVKTPPPVPEKGYNLLTGDYEVKQPSTPYPAPPVPFDPTERAERLPDTDWYSPEAIKRGQDIASALYPRPASLSAPSPLAGPYDVRMPLPRPLALMRAPQLAPTGGGGTVSAPIMRAAQPVSSPAPSAPVMRARPITYDQPRVTVPGTAGSVNGVDMAFMPISVQTSSRWRTGY